MPRSTRSRAAAAVVEEPEAERTTLGEIQLENAVEEEPKKRSTRKGGKKTKSAEEPTVVEDEPAEEEPAVVDATPAPKSKRATRGRKAKVVPEENENIEPAPTTIPEDTVEDEAIAQEPPTVSRSKSKRGGRKAKLAEENPATEEIHKELAREEPILPEEPSASKRSRSTRGTRRTKASEEAEAVDIEAAPTEAPSVEEPLPAKKTQKGMKDAGRSKTVKAMEVKQAVEPILPPKELLDKDMATQEQPTTNTPEPKQARKRVSRKTKAQDMEAEVAESETDVIADPKPKRSSRKAKQQVVEESNDQSIEEASVDSTLPTFEQAEVPQLEAKLEVKEPRQSPKKKATKVQRQPKAEKAAVARLEPEKESSIDGELDALKSAMEEENVVSEAVNPPQSVVVNEEVDAKAADESPSEVTEIDNFEDAAEEITAEEHSHSELEVQSEGNPVESVGESEDAILEPAAVQLLEEAMNSPEKPTQANTPKKLDSNPKTNSTLQRSVSTKRFVEKGGSKALPQNASGKSNVKVTRQPSVSKPVLPRSTATRPGQTSFRASTAAPIVVPKRTVSNGEPKQRLTLVERVSKPKEASTATSSAPEIPKSLKPVKNTRPPPKPIASLKPPAPLRKASPPTEARTAKPSAVPSQKPIIAARSAPILQRKTVSPPPVTKKPEVTKPPVSAPVAAPRAPSVQGERERTMTPDLPFPHKLKKPVATLALQMKERERQKKIAEEEEEARKKEAVKKAKEAAAERGRLAAKMWAEKMMTKKAGLPTGPQ